jgi:uncharacterized protein (DUF1684 family)
LARTVHIVFCGLFLLLLLALPAFSQAPDFAKEELAWRAQHVGELQKPDGWLSLIGLEWLQPGETTIGSAPDNKIHTACLGARSPGGFEVGKTTLCSWLLPTAASLPVCK